MRVPRFARLLLFALLVCLIPTSASAAVFVSVGFAPPVLPVYVQPPCPEPGWMWTPGYWAYGDDGYYWVPGTWVPAPYVGALWTPGYWGWSGGLFIWHAGYWGPHVGYYGGVNYGFGYMGVGFAGGVWAGGAFRYNTAVVRVNTTVIHNTYIDNTVVRNTTVVNSHVAYSGGPGGINHPPTAQETAYSHEQHMAATSFQAQHEASARGNVNAYANHNGGHPANLASTRPLNTGAGAHGAINYNSSKSNSGNFAAHGQAGGGIHNNERPAINQPQQHGFSNPKPQNTTPAKPQNTPASHGSGNPGGHEHEHGH